MAETHSEAGGARPPLLALDGQELIELTKASLVWLRHHQAVINALNVYPVPDGDTGTNMVLTMQSAWDEIARSEETNMGRVAHQLAHGALMGARGNSGVILSQIWRGFARGLDSIEECRAPDLVCAFTEAASTAYKGVVTPVEGTILTVIRAIADDASHTAQGTEDLLTILEHVAFAAHETVLLTPTLLPVLREAGVVDAGGQGLFVILEGMLRYLHGESLDEPFQVRPTAGVVGAAGLAIEATYGYDVQFLLVGEGFDVHAIREQINAMGDSALVVGDPATVKVHIHVPDPGVPISYGAGLGSLRDVVVEDMQAQFADFMAGRNGMSASSAASSGPAVVAVVMGDGLAQVFQSLGASAIVHGGQTMNPSTKDLLDAVEGLVADEVILLPNNKNVILAAEQARSLSTKSVAVVPSRTIPQGVSALLALNLQVSLEENVASMTAALDEVETGEITTATRSVRLNGVEVDEGQVIGLLNGDLLVAGDRVDDVAHVLLQQMHPEDCEIITLYYGNGVSEDEADALSERIRADWPEQEVEVVAGGQEHYHYIVSVE